MKRNTLAFLEPNEPSTHTPIPAFFFPQQWHVPLPLYYARPTVFGSASGERKRVIDWNDYNFETSTPQFEALQHFKPFYQRSVSYLLKRDNVDVSYQDGQQKNYL